MRTSAERLENHNELSETARNFSPAIKIEMQSEV
jgi:hypothetical protein